MSVRIAAVAVLAAALPPVVAAADAPARPGKLGLCAACHGEDGRAGSPGVPRLARQDETYLRDALAAYRDGRRNHDAMRAIAGALSPGDVEQLSRWYAGQAAP